MTKEEIVEREDWTQTDDNTPFWMRLYEEEFEPSEELEGTNTVGVELPKYLRESTGTVVASN